MTTVSRTDNRRQTIAVSCEIVAAYLRNNPIPADQVPDILTSVHNMLQSLRTGDAIPVNLIERAPKPVTLAQIRASIAHDALVSFEDGRQYKTLKRHLSTLGLTPNEYRTKWGLPATYPMVCPAYSLHRSEIAKSIGLGRPGYMNAREAAE